MGDKHSEREKIAQDPRETAIRDQAARQAGHVSRAQLLELGLSKGAIDRRLNNGSLVARYPGVYAIAPARDDPPALAAAAVLACGPHAALSHASAAYLWGFQRYWEPPPHVTLTHGDRRPGHILTHRCSSLKRRDISRQHDISITSPERTILDLAPRLTRKQLTRAINDARLNGYVHLATLNDVLARNPFHPGTKLLRPFAHDPSNPTRSGFEDDFKLFAAKYGLPTPLINTHVNGREVDAYFPEHRLIVELDGRDYHSDPEAFETDRERDAENLKHGLRTVRITTTRFTQTPDREADRLLEILGQTRGQTRSSTRTPAPCDWTPPPPAGSLAHGSQQRGTGEPVGEIEVMATYWTVSGPVKVHFGREWSTFSWEDRCAHAQRVGFTGLGLWHADVEHQLETTTLDEMAKVFRDHGLTYLEVEFLADFFTEPGTEQRKASDAQRRRLFETAAAFDAHHIKVGNIPETPCPLDRVVEEYAALCDDAAQHTNARISYEIIPFDPNVGTLEAGLRLVSEADRPNGGLAIDTWHMGKLQVDPERLASIPAEHIAWVELSDGRLEYMEDKIDEVINHRELPGEGEFDIPGYVGALHRAGYPGPWGAEILSEKLRNLPIEQEFDRAYETTMAQVSAGVALRGDRA